MNGPAPAGAFVGLLSRRGRFLIAEPFFTPARSEHPTQRNRRSQALVVSSARAPGARSAQPGELVLLSGARATRSRKGASERPRILRVIGRPDVARDVIEALMLDRGLRRGFDPAVEREARQAAAGEGAAADRRDLRELATFTIDPLSASDFDDAISAQTLDDGLVRVWVHIADVSAHVPLGSLLDGEARRRATSVYVPGAVEPMLPAALSNEACSLMAGKDRLAVTAELDFDGPTLKRSAFYRSLIRSDERLDYERVERIFAGLESACEPWAGALAAARGTAAALAEQRQRSAAVTLDSPEPQFSFDSEGNVSVIAGPGETSESHRLIEHLMIAANEAVAKLLERRAVPCLYRVHERPAPARIERLVDQLASLDVPTPAVPEHMSSTQAAALLGEISRLVDQHVLRASARARERRAGGSPTGGRLALTSLVLRSLQQAYYSPQNIGHSGLGSACYCHFTSPIRRYPDLVCHRALLDTLGLSNDRPIENSSDLVKLGAWSSEREREAMTIERDADDLASCFALEAALGHHGSEQVFDGEITGLISAGVFVAFGPSQDGAGRHGPLYEGMLPVRALSDYQEAPASGPVRARGSRSQGRGPAHTRSPTPREWWELGEHGTILHASRSGATLRLGDPIRVRVARVELARGRVGLALAGS